jgi:hypothetical protein
MKEGEINFCECTKEMLPGWLPSRQQTVQLQCVELCRTLVALVNEFLFSSHLFLQLRRIFPFL